MARGSHEQECERVPWLGRVDGRRRDCATLRVLHAATVSPGDTTIANRRPPGLPEGLMLNSWLIAARTNVELDSQRPLHRSHRVLEGAQSKMVWPSARCVGVRSPR